MDDTEGGAVYSHSGETGYSAEWNGWVAYPHGETGYSAEQAAIVAAGSRS
jgi:hypothetical protein